MENLTKSAVRDWCIGRGFHPNKGMGQNFLIDANVIDAILNAAEISEGTRVLEVGPGLGALTRGMISRNAKVTAVEKDTRLYEFLCAELADAADFIHADALEVNLDELLAKNFDVFISNLPYSVGTRILLDMCRHPLCPRTLVVTVQSEVADRLVAKPGEEARGLAGVWVQRTHAVECLRIIKPSCFWPQPEIDSTVVRLRRHDQMPPTPETLRANFEKITREAFSHRRKKMGTIFKGILPPDFPAEIRPECVTNEQWFALAKNVQFQSV